MSSAREERRLEKERRSDLSQKRWKWWVRTLIGLAIVGSFISVHEVDGLKEEVSELKQKLKSTFAVSTKTGISRSIGWGPDSNPQADGGLNLNIDTSFVSDDPKLHGRTINQTMDGLEIYNYSIYEDFRWPSAGADHAKSRVRLLDFVADSESFKEASWLGSWYAQDVFVLVPADGLFLSPKSYPIGMVWFNSGEKVYVGSNIDSIAYWAWRESEGFDSDVDEGKGRIFAMPKEGAWTFSMKDGLVRVEN